MTKIALVLISALFLSALVGLQVVKADIIGEYDGSVRYTTLPYIIFPRNKTYISKFLTLNVSFSAMIMGNINYSMTYSLDGISNETVPLVEHYFGWYRGFIKGESYISGFVILPELSEGSHSITVYLECHTHIWRGPNPDYYSYLDSDTVYFTITSEKWSEVTRFTGGGGITTTESFTCDHVEWRIRWEYEPRTDSLERTAFHVYVYPDEFHSPWFEKIIKMGTEETNGTLYIHDNNGTFYMVILASLESYTLIIEQDLESPTSIVRPQIAWFPDTTSPTISVASPENKTYTVNNVSLTFTVSEPTSWVGYSLDGQANVTITGGWGYSKNWSCFFRNTTLTGLSDSSHSLTVYAKDNAENTGASETIYFSITQQSEPFPTTWIVAAIAIIAIGGVALLVYFAKVKKS